MAKNKRFRLPLDNAAKIYPAVRNKKWSNVFRLSVTLTEEIDPIILQSALAVTIKRFPSMAMKLDNNFFWYYLEEISVVPKVIPDTPFPCSIMTLSEIKTCAFRVLYHEKRIAAEFFHSITDGNGGLIFLKTLTAEYLLQKEKVEITFDDGVLDRTGKPDKNESDDSLFGKIARDEILSFVDELPSLQRSVLMLHCIMGLSIDETVQRLNISLTVANKTH